MRDKRANPQKLARVCKRVRVTGRVGTQDMMPRLIGTSIERDGLSRWPVVKFQAFARLDVRGRGRNGAKRLGLSKDSER